MTLDMQCKIHGRIVPAADYETLRSLEHIVFGLTPTDWPDSMAHARALTVASELLASARVALRRKDWR